MGLYKRGVLNGLCRINFENQDVFDGFCTNGRMEGEGFFYDSGSNAWINGIFSEDCCVKLIHNGENFPKMEIKNFRSELHYQKDNFINRECSTVLVDITQLYSPGILCLSMDKSSLSQIREEEEFGGELDRSKSIKCSASFVDVPEDDLSDIFPPSQPHSNIPNNTKKLKFLQENETE